MASFREARREEAEAIPWVGGPRGAAEEAVLGSMQDDEIALLKVAVRATSGPYLCPDDALDLVGDDLAIERFAGEPNGAAPPSPLQETASTQGSGYRGRLCNAWATWENAGTKEGILASLRAYGLVDVQIFEDGELHMWPGEWFSRFRVVIGPNLGSVPAAEFDGFPTAIARQVLKWKSAHSYFVDLLVLPADATGDRIGIGMVIGESVIGDGSDNATALWVVGPLIGVSFTIGATKIGGYVIT